MDAYKVLVVEDDETARTQLSKAIRKEGYDVLMAEDGRAGLELFKKELPEIVVTDLKMPGMDGLELIHTIRRISTNVQIMVVTAFGETETAITALREGALDYLRKPIDLGELTVALGRAKEKVSSYKEGESFPTLLLAEDEEKVRQQLTRILEKEEWKVRPASNGDDAVKTFDQVKIDVALLDIKMPKKNGLQALHEMRAISDDFEAIILTGYGDEASAIQALRDGAINFLRKPIDLDQLILAVQKALEKLHLDRSLKFRIRELALARHIIARITSENEVLLDLSPQIAQPTRDFAQQLINAIPVDILLMDLDLNILFINKRLEELLTCRPQRMDEELINRLPAVGIKDLSYDVLRSTVAKIADSPPGILETISLGESSYVTLAPVTLLLEGREASTFVMMIRGERS